jgi:hypothetical protein
MHPFFLLFAEHDNIDVCSIQLVTSRLATEHRSWCSGHSIGVVIQSIVVQIPSRQTLSIESIILNIDKVKF